MPDTPTISTFADIQTLADGLDAIEGDARQLVAGLSEPQGAWRSAPGSWSVAECLDHLATATRVYLRAMRVAAETAHAAGKRRRGPATPGLIGGWFVRSLEPPVRPRLRGKAPRIIRPRVSPPLADAFREFLLAHDEARAFLRDFADDDLAGVTFANPFIRGVRFSLATGLHVIAAHDRRHLWQAWRVRHAADRSAAA